MMFYEIHRGYVGLGSMTIYRTAQQTAHDIETFGKETGDIAKQGGLLNMQNVMKYSASQGRLQEVQNEVTALQSKLATLQQRVEGMVRELEGMGVTGAGDYAKMAAKMVISAKIPLIGWLSAAATIGSMVGINLSFLDIDMFGDKKKKKEKIERLIREIEATITQMKFWSTRMAALQNEGESLAKTVAEGGAGAINVKLIALPQHTEVKNVYTDVKDASGIIRGSTYQQTRTIKDTPESKAYGRTILKTSEELSERVNLAPTGDRLPVGFQTIYSPVLENGKVVAKVPVVNHTLPGPVDRRVVYGGLLSGVGVEYSENRDFFCSVATVVAIAAIVYGLTTMKR